VIRLGTLPRFIPGLFAGLLLASCGSAATAPSSSQPASGSAVASAKPAASAASAASAQAPASAKPSAAAPPSQPGVTVRLATKGSPSEAALAISLKRGYWQKQGLNIESVAADSGPQMVPALATNQLQVGAGAMSASLFNALNRDVNIRMVADFSHVGSENDTTLALLVRKDLADSGAVKSVADLKGRTVGLGTNPGTVSDFLLARALDKAGASGIKMDVQYLAFPDILTALANKKIDAGTLTEPLATSAVQKDIARVLTPAGAVIPGSELSILQFSPQFAADQSAATRFMIGYLQGVRDHYDAFFQNKGKEELISLLVQTLAEKDPKVWETSKPTFTDLNGKINVDDLKAQGAYYKQTGNIQGDVPDITKFVDSKFADEAVKQIGAR